MNILKKIYEFFFGVETEEQKYRREQNEYYGRIF